MSVTERLNAYYERTFNRDLLATFLRSRDRMRAEAPGLSPTLRNLDALYVASQSSTWHERQRIHVIERKITEGGK